MAAVLRVKRRCDEEPLEALVLACKRRKETEEDVKGPDDSIAAVLKFSNTVKTQENNLSLLLPVNEREDIWKSRLTHKVDISNKIREQRKQFSVNSRYKVVNCFRQVDESVDEDAEKRNVVIFDIENSESSLKNSNKQSISDEEINYVYDIYYGQTNNEYDFTSLEHLVDIMPVTSFDFGADGASDDDSLAADDDDDSNDENNWRNDYPDSDHSMNEDEMRLAMQMGDMNLENDLSSSDDEGMIYETEADPQDVEYYGEVYAKYRARIIRQLHYEIEESSDDENENSDEDDDDDDSGEIASDDENEDPILRFM